jgi:hypothetical protein
VAPPGNKAIKGKNKHQPIVSGEAGLLASKNIKIKRERGGITRESS